MPINKSELAGIKPAKVRAQGKYSLEMVDMAQAYTPQELAAIWGMAEAAKKRAIANKRDAVWATASAYKALWVKLNTLIRAGKAVAKPFNGVQYIEFLQSAKVVKPSIAAKGISPTQ